MFPPRAGRVRPTLCLVSSALLVVGLPVRTHAGPAEKQPSFADRMRHGPGVANHPVHVVPSSEVHIPDGWPLDVDGTLACVTCHERLPLLNGSTPAFLRDFEDKPGDSVEFCAKCHSSGSRRTAAGMHWMAVRRAHLGPRSEGASTRPGQLDAASRLCLSCHDGVTAVESVNPMGRSPRGGSYAERGRNHPIGVSYPRSTSRKHSTPFRPASLLPGKVALPGGRVGCVSCHNLYGEDRSLLTVPIEGSKLCLTCHQMD